MKIKKRQDEVYTLLKNNTKCPKCGEGDVVERKSKKGKKFYGCSRYPECDFISNKPPSGDRK